MLNGLNAAQADAVSTLTGPLLVLAGALVYGAPAGAARKLVSHRGLTAYMPNDFACAEQVTIFVTGARSAFQGEKLGLQRLTGGVLAAAKENAFGLVRRPF